MSAKLNKVKTSPTVHFSFKTNLVRRVLLLAGLAIVPVLQYGCAGVTSKSVQTQPPPGTPQLSMTPTSVSFGSVSDGTSNTQTVQLKNTGTAALNITQISATGTEFSLTGVAS